MRRHSRNGREQQTGSFADDVVAWFRAHGRHDLPWQHTRTPYRVWISEIMLQQTQVTTVIPYYQRFLERFPDVITLADAPLDDVLACWAGLGYYARARNLRKAAVIVRDYHNGQFPEQLDEVVALPGIGRSTAGAILSLSRGERHAILDGNVKRVLARYFAVAGWPGKKKVADQLWQHAEALTPAHDVASYNQAIMDIGSTVCTRMNPLCHECPVKVGCVARATGTVDDYPGRKPKAKRMTRATTMMIAVDDRRVLLQRRPPSGIWGGLWSLPELDADADPDQWCSSHLGRAPVRSRRWPVLQHSFTHFDLDITPVYVDVAGPGHLADSADYGWYDLPEAQQLGIPAPVATLLKQLSKQLSAAVTSEE